LRTERFPGPEPYDEKGIDSVQNMLRRDSVIYQIYPRSFQDSDGDGVGDLRGIAGRLDHLSDLGVDALWLSPIYPSPLADFGYDVADYTGIDPVFGSLEDFDALVAAAHERGIGVLLDLVPSHTSIEHPWFREHPDWYIWSPVDGPANNWLAAFGGGAWSQDPVSGRWYLHSFYPEQPDLDWRNPEVRAAMADVVRFWIDRGVDGFRVDAITQLLKDAEFRDEPVATEPFGLPVHADRRGLAVLHSSNAPGIQEAIGTIREAAGDKLLVGEVYLPSAQAMPYLEHFDAVFAFEVFHAEPTAERLRDAIEAAATLVRGQEPGAAWVLSNHDFAPVPTRFGRANERVAAMMLLTLPGMAFVYQGDEIGLDDGPGHDPPFDRAGRDSARHPMQWDATPGGGFSDAEPWLPLVDPEERNVAGQAGDPDSLLELYRGLIALRRELGPGIRLLDAADGVLAYQRGDDHVVALNFSGEDRPAPPHGELLIGAAADGVLAPHSGFVARAARR
jgi:alpha-glucosidase